MYTYTLIDDLGSHKMLNINFRGTHVFESLFSIQLSSKSPSGGLSDNFENFMYLGLTDIAHIGIKLMLI